MANEVFSEIDKARIVEAIQQRAPQSGACPFCRHNKWVLQDGFVVPNVQRDPRETRPSGLVMPSVVMTCTHCGNTLIFNVAVLGLDDLMNRPERNTNG